MRDADALAKRLKHQRLYFEKRGRKFDPTTANLLTDAEWQKIEEFDELAIARTPKEAKKLSKIRGEIAWEREQRALSQFKPNERLIRWLDQNLGFKKGATALGAAHKGLRAEASFIMSKRLRKFYRDNKDCLFFYYVTFIHDGWRTLDRDTQIDLKDIKERVRNVMYRHKLNHIGVIEFDALNNYPLKVGLCIMPHVHMVVWSTRDIEPATLEADIATTTRLKSSWGAPTVKVSSRLTEDNVVHKAYYMFEQNFKCKRLGPANSKTGERRLHPVYKWVPPHLTLRLSEILANCTLKDLILSSGEGREFKGSLLKALRAFNQAVGLGRKPVGLTAAQAFQQLRARTTRGIVRDGVRIKRK